MSTAVNGVRIRPGAPSDVPAVLAMMDTAVAWMNQRGNTEQWGTTPPSERPKTVARVERYLTDYTPRVAELDGAPVGVSVLAPGPDLTVPIPLAEEPERYVRLLLSDRAYAGRGIGAALLAHGAAETRRAGVALLRVDCWAGGGGRLVAFYERCGFVPAEHFQVGTWPGRVLAQRVS